MLKKDPYTFLFLDKIHPGSCPVSLFPVKYLEHTTIEVDLVTKHSKQNLIKHTQKEGTNSSKTYIKSTFARWMKEAGISPVKLLKLRSLHCKV